MKCNIHSIRKVDILKRSKKMRSCKRVKKKKKKSKSSVNFNFSVK